MFPIRAQAGRGKVAHMPSDTHWEEARVHLREWMAVHNLSQNRLARLAGLNRSIIHRFLEKDQPLSQESASKLYQTIRLSLDPANRQRWIEWLDLTQVAALLLETEPAPESDVPPILHVGMGPYP